jgi:hypothetical protein
MTRHWNELTSLEQILAWMQSNGVPLDQLDLIPQDEFCHDLLLPHEGHWMVFGLT